MVKSIEEIKAKIEEIERLKASGDYKKWEDASKAAGMGKNWYFDNIKKITKEAKSTDIPIESSIKQPKEAISIDIMQKEQITKKNNKSENVRVTITLSKKRYDYFKTKAENNGMELAPLLSFTIGEAQDKGLI